MNRYVKLGLYIVGMIALFAVGYIWKYSMGTTESFEVNVGEGSDRLLIATQQSEYKDEVVKSIVDYFDNRSLNIKVIDISDLANVNGGEYNNIVIIHTWEYNSPPQPVKAFISKLKDKKKIYALSTSSDGTYYYDQVDGISSASRMLSVSDDANKIINWIEPRLIPTP